MYGHEKGEHVLTRKASAKWEADWFFFSSGLMLSLCSDYIAVRLLLFLEPATTGLTILPKMLDVAEKAMKVHLSVQTETATALTDARTKYGHNVEKLRAACATYHQVFDDRDIRAFTKDLNDRGGQLYQQLRYGAQETTVGFEANLSALLPALDKIFCKSLLLLPEHHKGLLIFSSPLKQLIVGSRFDQTRSRDQVIAALRIRNAFYDELVECCHRLDDDHAALKAKLDALRKA